MLVITPLTYQTSKLMPAERIFQREREVYDSGNPPPPPILLSSYLYIYIYIYIYISPSLSLSLSLSLSRIIDIIKKVARIGASLGAKKIEIGCIYKQGRTMVCRKVMNTH